MEEGQEAHWEIVERILFLYAKLNPGQGYVQGMNEIIGPIYYVLASDPNIEYRGLYYHFTKSYIENLFFIIIMFLCFLLFINFLHRIC